MKEAVLFVYFLVSTTMGLLSQQCDSAKLTGPYFGQKPPEMIPKIFAPGIISKNESDEWGLAVNKEWTEIFFSRSKNDKASVFHTERQSTIWSKPSVAEFSGDYNDSHPAFANDGTKLFFGSKRPCPGSKAELNLWFTVKINGIWNSPKSCDRPLIDQTVHAASVSPGGDIYATGLVVFEKDYSGYKVQQKLQPDVPGSQPAVSPDGNYIVFSHRGKENFGGNDLYITYKTKNNSWSVPVNLGKDINTKYVESSPTISLDGKFLFFSRNGDIYWVSTKGIENHKSVSRD